MRHRHFQFSIRQLFLLVAIAAVLAGSVLVYQEFSVDPKTKAFRTAEAKKQAERAK